MTMGSPYAARRACGGSQRSRPRVLRASRRSGPSARSRRRATRRRTSEQIRPRRRAASARSRSGYGSSSTAAPASSAAAPARPGRAAPPSPCARITGTLRGAAADRPALLDVSPPARMRSTWSPGASARRRQTTSPSAVRTGGASSATPGGQLERDVARRDPRRRIELELQQLHRADRRRRVRVVRHELRQHGEHRHEHDHHRHACCARGRRRSAQDLRRSSASTPSEVVAEEPHLEQVHADAALLARAMPAWLLTRLVARASASDARQDRPEQQVEPAASRGRRARAARRRPRSRCALKVVIAPAARDVAEPLQLARGCPRRPSRPRSGASPSRGCA